MKGDRSRHAHFKLHKKAWKRHHRARRPLQKQLFLSFGLAIVVAMSVAAWVASALPTSISGRPFGRGLAYLAAGVVVWAIAGMWARRLLGPLRELTRVAAELGAGKLQSRVRLPRAGTREVWELGQTFNEMAARIEEHVKNQNELLHSVSHELRTPLARLRVLLGILADGDTHQASLAQGTARFAKLTEDMEREVLELDQLVGELLAGARIDAGALQKRSLNVAESVQGCLARTGLSDVALQIAPGLTRVSADPTLLSRALIVLLDNATKHGEGARAVHVERRDDVVRFSVADRGQGIDPADLPRLFVPFARGRGQSPDERHGLGLGLYLVRRIAQAHGGDAFAHNGPEGGAVVGFTLRVEEPSSEADAA